PVLQRERLGDWVFGCDACQDVCPWNRTALPEGAVAPGFAPSPRWAGVDAADLLTMEEDGFRALTEGSPVRRAGVDGLARNAAVVLGNVGERCHLPVLDAAAGSHPSEVVRDAASWAADRIRTRGGVAPSS